MRIKYFFSTILIFSLFTFVSCDQFKKEKATATDQFDISGKSYTFEPITTTIYWTAYKTTAKTPVKGQFNTLNISNIKKSSTAREALNGLEFSIPVSSLFSNNDDRDTKLKKLFFGVMDNTELLSGTFKIVGDTKAQVDLKMNGKIQTIPLTYFLNGQMISMEGMINIDDWDTQLAFDSLHKACEDKHTGDDGVSKTWKEVKINVESYLKIE